MAEAPGWCLAGGTSYRALSWLVLVVAAIVAGGQDYWLGIATSTLARPQSNVPVPTILHSAYVWISLILVLAALGAVLASRSKTRGKFLPAVLAAAALLAPAEQSRLHQLSACRSTWCSARGSRQSQQATRWRA